MVVKNVVSNKQNNLPNTGTLNSEKNVNNNTSQTTLRTDITKELHQLNINKADITAMLKKDLLTSCEQIAQQFEILVPKVLQIAEKRFVSMKNVPVWYDREQTLLFSNKMHGFSYIAFNNAKKSIKNLMVLLLGYLQKKKFLLLFLEV